MRVVLATGNPGKLQELQALLAPLGFEVAAAVAVHARERRGNRADLRRERDSQGAARRAARGLPAIADDSGLEVDALQGAPGIYSARYAGERASDEDNLRKLLAALRGRKAAERTARYRCALVYMRWEHDPSPLICQASWEGRITEAPRGSGGFGYDPIFELSQRSVTAAELPAAEKNQLSHRGKALRGLVAQLRESIAGRR